jgi:hypothetical protein
MSLIDLQNMFSNQQAITADAISTRVIDTNPNASDNLTVDIAAGKPLYLHILVTTALVSAGSGTLTVALESDDNTSLSSATVHATVASAIAAGTMVAGYWIARNYPIPAGSYQRYVGLRYTTNPADFETGNVTAWLSPTKMDTATYESGYTTGIN